MADTEELLAQLLGQNAPAAQSLEQQQLARRRALAMAQYQATQQQPQRNYRRSPIAFALDGLMGLEAQDKLKSYDAQEVASAARTAQGRNAEMTGLIKGLETRMEPQAGPTQDGEPLPPIQVGDPKAALVQAMSSAHPEVRALASALQKQREGLFKNVLDATKDRVDPNSVVTASQGLDPKMFQFPKPQAPFLTSATPPGGTTPVTYGVTTNKDGTQDMRFLPAAGTTVTVDTANKATTPVFSELGKNFIAGGEQYKNATKLKQSLSNTQDILDTLARDPQMGAGAAGFQILRKWAQTLGAPVNEKTTPTEIASMQLGQKTLDRLGGLGAQVSDADRKFMLDVQGSLGSDPAAVRRLLMLDAKYTMKALQEHNEQADQVRKVFEGKVPIPSVNFNFRVPQNYLAEMQEVFGAPNDPAPPRPPVRELKLPGRIQRMP